MSYRVCKIVVLVAVLIGICVFVPFSVSTSDSYSGEYIKANKVYMPDNNIKLVIYFNESDTTKFVVFDDWDARHSILLSNMVEGKWIKINYNDYIFKDCKQITGIEYV